MQSNRRVQLSLVLHSFHALVFFRKPGAPRMLVQDSWSHQCTRSICPGTSSSLGCTCCITGAGAVSELRGITAYAPTSIVVLRPATQHSQMTLHSAQSTCMSGNLRLPVAFQPSLPGLSFLRCCPVCPQLLKTHHFFILRENKQAFELWYVDPKIQKKIQDQPPEEM